MKPAQTEALLRHVVRGLVQHPAEVQVTARASASAPCWELRVDPRDFSRVVGRGGRTARALRALLEAADRGPHRPALNILDPEDDGQPV